jgi:hypothetical protein
VGIEVNRNDEIHRKRLGALTGGGGSNPPRRRDYRGSQIHVFHSRPLVAARRSEQGVAGPGGLAGRRASDRCRGLAKAAVDAIENASPLPYQLYSRSYTLGNDWLT